MMIPDEHYDMKMKMHYLLINKFKFDNIDRVFTYAGDFRIAYDSLPEMGYDVLEKLVFLAHRGFSYVVEHKIFVNHNHNGVIVFESDKVITNSIDKLRNEYENAIKNVIMN